MEKIKQIIVLLGINIIPGLVIHLLLIPFWLFLPPLWDWLASLSGILSNVFILPCILTFLNLRFNKRNKIHGYLFNGLFMLVSMYLWNLYQYISWSIASGSFYISSPDIETVAISRFVFIINALSILVIGVVLHLYLKQKGKERDANPRY